MKNLVKYGRVVYESCERTDRQRDTELITIHRAPPGCEVIKLFAVFYRTERREKYSVPSLSTDMIISAA